MEATFCPESSFLADMTLPFPIGQLSPWPTHPAHRINGIVQREAVIRLCVERDLKVTISLPKMVQTTDPISTISSRM